MTRDPIVDEVRVIRDEIARAFDYDIDAIFEALRKLEQESGEPRLSLPPRRPFAEVERIAVQPSVAADE